MKTFKSVGLVIFLALLSITGIKTAEAHQPNLVANKTNIIITDPEISKAYYGELTGQPVNYVVRTKIQFSLYANILVPDLKNSTTNFSVKIANEKGELVSILDGPNYKWDKLHEDFAGDDYLKGPEYKTNPPPGIYTLTVSNPGNLGKYVLAVGETEVAPSKNLGTLSTLYNLKAHFFQKPWYSIFQGIIGHYLLGVAIILVILILIAFFFIKKAIIKQIKLRENWK